MIMDFTIIIKIKDMYMITLGVSQTSVEVEVKVELFLEGGIYFSLFY
jgi:hypothetical protein